MQMDKLPIELIYEIATQDPEVWYLLSQVLRVVYIWSFDPVRKKAIINSFTNKTIDKQGWTEYRNHKGKLFRWEKDKNGLFLPSREHKYGSKVWTRFGLVDRRDKCSLGYILPAIILCTGENIWHKEGKIHRLEFDEEGSLLPAYTCFHYPGTYYIGGKLLSVEQVALIEAGQFGFI